MKRFYSRFRIALMTFALGLASVWMFNGLNSNEIYVELPKVQSDYVIFVLPIENKTIKILTYRYGCGGTIDNRKKKIRKIQGMELNPKIPASKSLSSVIEKPVN